MVKAWAVVAAALAIAVAPAGTARCAIEAGQVEVAGAATYIANLAGSDQTAYQVDVSVHKLFTVDLYTMGSSTSAPYMGAGIGRGMWREPDSSGAVSIVEGHLGYKTFVRESTAVSIEARYEARASDLDNGFLGVHAGLSVFF